jgi:DNA-binding MarR family transcriptional regulator
MPLSTHELIQVNQALFSLTHAYDARMASEHPPKDTGMTLYDCAVLMVIGQFSPINSGEVANRMQVAASTISVYIRRLNQKGLVEMERDASDRRVWQLRLTEAGRMAYAMIVEGTARYTQDFLSGLTEREQDTLHELLQKIAHHLGFAWQ